MELIGVLVQMDPRMDSSVVLLKFPSIEQANPLERPDSRAVANTVLQSHPGKVFSLSIQICLLSFSWVHVRSPLAHPTGGPGESGVNFTLAGAGQLLNRLAGGYYDIVSWDPRGVGLTT